MASNDEFEWDTTVTRVYQEVVAEADPKAGTTKSDAFEISAQRLARMVRDGELFVDVDQAIRAALDRADDTQGRSADRVIKRIATGQDVMAAPGDPLLSTVVKLGDGKRKSWRHVTAEDLRAMDVLRYQNYRKQFEAYNQWREHFDRVLPSVSQHGTVGGAVAAGAFDPSSLAA